MPRPVPSYVRLEQPMNWGRALFCGVIGALLLMAWIDIFAMLGVTPFCLELFVGTVIQDSTQYLTRAWIWGFLGNLVIGAVFGIFYAYLFEFIVMRSGARVGLVLGLLHALVAAVAVLPFFVIVHNQMGIQLYPSGFGFLGGRLGIATPLVIVSGHLLFGAEMGVFYGPVRVDRIRTQNFEPGEVGFPGDPDVITPSEDPSDATPSLPYHAPGGSFPHYSAKKRGQGVPPKPPSRSA